MNNQTSSNNRSFLQRPGAVEYDDPDEALEQITGGTVTSATTTSAVVGTPEDLVAAIRQVAHVTGGFGKVIGFAHDWANREDTLRSWDLVARYVIPEVNGLIANLRESQEFVAGNRGIFEQAGRAVMAKIQQNPDAAAAAALDGGPKG